MHKLKRKKYDKLLEPMQGELLQMARWVEQTGQRVLILFEGRDTAGKGGVIGDIAGTLNPRQCRTVALTKPDEREKTQWYFQRYIEHLPAAGEIVLFDRSWYNRAGVEKVMGYCTDAQYHAFLEQVPAFERLLTDDGILLFKYWQCVDQAQQEERFAERASDPLKRWKLSPIDVKARESYVEYGRARDAMRCVAPRANAEAPPGCNAHPSASHTSTMVGRRSRSWESMRRTSASSHSGACGATSRRGRKTACEIPRKICPKFSPAKGTWPLTDS